MSAEPAISNVLESQRNSDDLMPTAAAMLSETQLPHEATSIVAWMRTPLLARNYHCAEKERVEQVPTGNPCAPCAALQEALHGFAFVALQVDPGQLVAFACASQGAMCWHAGQEMFEYVLAPSRILTSSQS